MSLSIGVEYVLCRYPCCSVLQCVAECDDSVLQCAAVYCRVVHCVSLDMSRIRACIVLQYVAVCGMLQCAAVCCTMSHLI